MSNLYPKRESNVKLTLEQQRAASRPRPGGMNCYDVAKVRNITPDEAARWVQVFSPDFLRGTK